MIESIETTPCMCGHKTLEGCIQDCLFEIQTPEEIPLSEEDLDMLSLETQEQKLE